MKDVLSLDLQLFLWSADRNRDVARLADTGNTGAGALVLDGSPRGRLFAADNFTRTQDFGVRLKAYLDGPAGKAMYQRFFAATIAPNKLRAACHLYDFAGYSQGLLRDGVGPEIKHLRRRHASPRVVEEPLAAHRWARCERDRRLPASSVE